MNAANPKRHYMIQPYIKRHPIEPLCPSGANADCHHPCSSVLLLIGDYSACHSASQMVNEMELAKCNEPSVQPSSILRRLEFGSPADRSGCGAIGGQRYHRAFPSAKNSANPIGTMNPLQSPKNIEPISPTGATQIVTIFAFRSLPHRSHSGSHGASSRYACISLHSIRLRASAP